MTLLDLLEVVLPINEMKVLNLDDAEILYDNVFPTDITTLAGASDIDLNDFVVSSMCSLTDWKRHTTYIEIVVRKVVCK